MSSSKNQYDYWVACSGGVDSIVLVRLFKELNKNFGILHCNFKLRGVDSDNDEEFVRNLADEIDVPIKVRVFDVNNYIKEQGGNVQLAARNLRYRWFEEVKSKYKAKIVLGHHKDDQIETFLLQLRRGGKLKGLSSMPLLNEGYVRPLLSYSKLEIYDLARQNNWAWREDSSNKKSDYLRNYYRNELIPSFENISWLKTEILGLVQNFQVLLNFSERYLNQRFNFSKDVEVSFSLWDSWAFWLKQLFVSESGIAPISVKEVDRLRNSQKGKYLSNEFKSIWNEGNRFLMRSSNDFIAFPEYQIKTISSSTNVDYKEDDVFIDKDKVQGNIRLRKWREGESFQPLGMKGQKKISKFLRDRKVSSSEKKNYPVIVDETDQIIGVARMCPDERYKVDEKTNNILVIKFTTLSSD